MQGAACGRSSSSDAKRRSGSFSQSGVYLKAFLTNQQHNGAVPSGEAGRGGTDIGQREGRVKREQRVQRVKRVQGRGKRGSTRAITPGPEVATLRPCASIS